MNKYLFIKAENIIMAALIFFMYLPVFCIGPEPGIEAFKPFEDKESEYMMPMRPIKPQRTDTVPAESKLFTYLSVEENRQRVMKRALQLNGGQYVNACVYFTAEALRENGVDIPISISETTELVTVLKKKGWRCSPDYRKLQPGDICFTTDRNDGSGAPSHTYIFMGWVSPGNFDYAMICDNQADRYGAVYHKRNIRIIDFYKGEKKEAFRFFMRK